MFFKENLMSNVTSNDLQYLFMCQFLNLRHSTVAGLYSVCVPSLRFVDLAFSRIKYCDLSDCIHLEKLIADESQEIHVLDNVQIERVFDTCSYLN